MILTRWALAALVAGHGVASAGDVSEARRAVKARAHETVSKKASAKRLAVRTRVRALYRAAMWSAADRREGAHFVARLIHRDVRELAALEHELDMLDAALRPPVTQGPLPAWQDVQLAPIRAGRVRVVRGFGDQLDRASGAKTRSHGVSLRVSEGAVRAPYPGRVLWSGTLHAGVSAVLLEHRTPAGARFWTLISGIEATAPAGSLVGQGDELGRTSGSEMYFEVRKETLGGSAPVDPSAYIARWK